MNRACRILLLIILVWLPRPGMQAVLPLRDQWRAACHSLATGQAGPALEQFREFEEWYGAEPVVMEPSFKRKQRRLWGLVALQAGAIEEGLPLLEQWLASSDPQTPHYAFIRFQAALGYRSREDNGAAVRHWELFLDAHPELPECALIRWMWADLFLEQGQPEAAQEQLQTVIEEEQLPLAGRALARAALSLVDLSLEEQASALDHLSVLDDEKAGPVMRLWRALLAPSLASGLMDQRPADAVRVTTWFDRQENLLTMLRPWLEKNDDRKGNPRQRLWQQHWNKQLLRLEQVIGQTEKTGMALHTLYSLRLQAFLKAGQPDMALTLVRMLLDSNHPSALEIRSHCYAVGIEASLDLAHWDQADSLASEFLKGFPDNPDVPVILFLKARMAARRNDFASAISQADPLISTYPGHRSVLAWRMSSAGWHLEANLPKAALERFMEIEAEAPPSWQPYLKFQQARCLEKLLRTSEATALMVDVSSHPQAPAGLREQALTALLEAALRQWDEGAFNKWLQCYRKAFPDGANQLHVENLAGTFFRMKGHDPEAIALFSTVSKRQHPASAFAHEQLSSIYLEKKDMPALRHHALDWIHQSIRDDRPIPSGALADCIAFQTATGEAALPGALLSSLMERFCSEDPGPPGIRFLELIKAGWATYATVLQTGTPFDQWLQERNTHFRETASWAPFTQCQLFMASELERMQRHDSADTKRIEILQSVDSSQLDEGSLFAVSMTADKYDFPESTGLLRSFLKEFPYSDHRPEILYRLACRLRTSAQPGEATSLLAEIRHKWLDAPIHERACLTMAHWTLEDGRPLMTMALLDDLLTVDGLTPIGIAEALLMRAQADFQTGNIHRGQLGCERILVLYPAFTGIADTARNLLNTHPSQSSIPDV